MLNVQRVREVLADLIEALELSPEDARTIAHDVINDRNAYRADRLMRDQDPQVVAFAGALRALDPGVVGIDIDDLVKDAVDMLAELDSCDCADQVSLVRDVCGRHHNRPRVASHDDRSYAKRTIDANFGERPAALGLAQGDDGVRRT